MDADIQGCLNSINRSWRAFEHNGKPMTKIQVEKVLEYAISKGYKFVSEITDEEFDNVIDKIK